MQNRKSLVPLSIVGTLCALIYGCGGTSGGTGGESIDLTPKSVTLSRGQSQQFLGETLDYSLEDTTWRVIEANGGTIVDGGTIASGSDAANNYQRTALYTAPAQAGKYHVQFVYNNGAAPESSATATVIVTAL